MFTEEAEETEVINESEEDLEEDNEKPIVKNALNFNLFNQINQNN